jgi:hypothetical protein
MDKDILLRRAHLGALVQETMKDQPDLAHFEHKLTGNFVLTENLERIANLRADENWREVGPTTAS